MYDVNDVYRTARDLRVKVRTRSGDLRLSRGGRRFPKDSSFVIPLDSGIES